MASNRFETLNPQTQDLVDCLIPGIISNWSLENISDAIPEDIRMRKWDCARKDHIINEAENDARNWGVSFLKDLLTISRLTKGQLEVFQNDLRAQLSKNKGLHGWIRLKDIRELKKQYDGSANMPSESDSEVIVGSAGASDETDSEEEEDEEVVIQKVKKRGRPLKQPKHKHKSSKRHKAAPPARLRRSSEKSWERRDKSYRHHQAYDPRRPPGFPLDEPIYYPDESYLLAKRPAIKLERQQSYMGAPDSTKRFASPSVSRPSFMAPSTRFASPSISSPSFMTPGNLPKTEYDQLSKEQLELQYEVANAELKAKKLRLAIVMSKHRAGAIANMDGEGTQDEPHLVDDE